MAQGNSPPPINASGDSATDPATDQEASTASGSAGRAAASQRRWLPALGVLILLAGLGFGWRWWQGQMAGGPPRGGAMAGGPQGAPVRIETATTETVLESSEFIGSLEADGSSTVRSEITGRISQIFVEEGERVTAGTPLVQLNPERRQADVAAVQAAVNSARALQANASAQLEALRAERVAQAADVELQGNNFRRVSGLVEAGALAQQDLDDAQRNRETAIAALNALDRRIDAAQASLDEARSGLEQAQANANRATTDLQDTLITAPFDGVVGNIPVSTGDVVSASDPLTTLTRNQVMTLRLSVPIERAPELSIGQRVELIDANGEVSQGGEITVISPNVEANAQTVGVSASFDNQGGLLRDGQFVQARLIWQEQPGVLVPSSAISRLAGESFIFVAEPASEANGDSPNGGAPPADAAPGGPPDAAAPENGNGQPLVAVQRQVRLGRLQGNSYQVLDGLEPGELVVVSGVLNLFDGSPISPIPGNGAALDSAAQMAP